jgi:superfamily II DNA/RNA helicase
LFSSKNRKKTNQKAIDPAKFVNKAVTAFEETPFVAMHTFTDFGFDARLQANITKHGYESPTPIQDGAIPFVLAGRDLIGLANTGTGKTAAFLLPLLQRLLAGQVKRCLIVVPTRELAVQIEDEFRLFAAGLPLRSALVVGGASIAKQQQALQRRPQFVMATPGRLRDLTENYGLGLADFDAVVLDEADRMLDMGFIRDIRTILDKLSSQRQTLFLSATITPEIEQLTHTILKDPETVSVRRGETSDHVDQDIIEIEGGKAAKEEKLIELLGQSEFKKVLIFGETKWGVQKLADRLSLRGLAVAAIHGNKSQPQRQKALAAFRTEKVQALVATDVAARGLDIPRVTHVINYDPPKVYEDYVHRIGRTGRAGEVGKALTFVLTGPGAYEDVVRPSQPAGPGRQDRQHRHSSGSLAPGQRPYHRRPRRQA